MFPKSERLSPYTNMFEYGLAIAGPIIANTRTATNATKYAHFQVCMVFSSLSRIDRQHLRALRTCRLGTQGPLRQCWLNKLSYPFGGDCRDLPKHHASDRRPEVYQRRAKEDALRRLWHKNAE